MAWSLTDLDALLPQLPARGKAPAALNVFTAVEGVALEPLAVPGEVPSRALQRVREAPNFTLGEKRSGQTFALVMMCLEHGWAAGVTLGFLLTHEHKPSLSRYGSGGLPLEVARIYSKHPHVGQSCLLARCTDTTAPLMKATAKVYRDGEPVPVTLARVLAAVDSHQWQGQAGRTSAALMVAYITLAARAGSLTFDASRRDAAELAGVNQKTVDNHRPRLVDDGWTAVTDNRTRPTDSLSYTLLLTHVGPHNSQRGERGTAGWCGPNQARSDAFRHGRSGGLGKTAADIYAALEQEPMSVAALAPTVRCTEKTAKKWVEVMQGHGMVKLADGVWHAQDVDWHALGDQRGTNGLGERQRDHHASERQQMQRSIRDRKRVRNAQEQFLLERHPALSEMLETGVGAGWEAAKALLAVDQEITTREASAAQTRRMLGTRRNRSRHV